MAQDPQKLGLLNALAQNGSAGATDFQQQANSQNSAKQQAVSAAASRAGLVGAPAEFLAKQQAIVSQPYDQAMADAERGASTLGGYMGTMNQAHSNYLGQLKAAQPVLQAQLNRVAAKKSQALRERAAKQQDDNLIENTRFQWAMEDRQAEQATAQKEAQSAAVSQEGLAKIVSHSNPKVREFGLDIIGQAGGDIGAALAALQDEDNLKEFQKNGIDPAELRSSFIQYYAPETYSLLPKPQAPAPGQVNTQAPAAKQKEKKKGGQSLWDGLTRGIGFSRS